MCGSNVPGGKASQAHGNIAGLTRSSLAVTVQGRSVTVQGRSVTLGLLPGWLANPDVLYYLACTSNNNVRRGPIQGCLGAGHRVLSGALSTFSVKIRYGYAD